MTYACDSFTLLPGLGGCCFACFLVPPLRVLFEPLASTLYDDSAARIYMLLLHCVKIEI
jgi:hypothetical protein